MTSEDRVAALWEPVGATLAVAAMSPASETTDPARLRLLRG